MNLITEKCTGCRACEHICPKSCISMHEDEEGFLQPIINQSECIKCNMCRKKCPQNNEMKKEILPKVYALRMKNDEVLRKSASGGAFAVFSKYILENGGVVFGAAYNNDMKVLHIMVENDNDLQKLQSSKYVQSNTLDTYKQCKHYLENGRYVLYSGTPCQIAGLYAFLGKEYNRLYTLDLICHGVPSPLLFEKYIKWLEYRQGEKIIEYNFRSKEKNGWGLGCKTRTKRKIKYFPAQMDPYYSEFLEGAIYRECCYDCRYASLQRVGDITIGDFWGIEKIHPQFMSKKGISAILINSNAGMELLNSVIDKIYIYESNTDNVSRMNGNLKSPTIRPKRRDSIYKNIKSYDSVKYINSNFPVKVSLKTYVKYYTPRCIKDAVKKLMKG